MPSDHGAAIARLTALIESIDKRLEKLDEDVEELKEDRDKGSGFLLACTKLAGLIGAGAWFEHKANLFK